MRTLGVRVVSDLVRRRPGWILIFGALASVVGGYFTSRLGLRSDLADLLPEDYESVRALHEVQDAVGGTGSIRVVIGTEDFAAAVRFAEELRPRLLASSYVLDVELERDVEFYRRNALLYLRPEQLDSLHRAIEDAIEAERQEANPFVVDDLFAESEEDDEEPEGTELERWEERYEDRLPLPYYMDADSTVLVLQAYAAAGRTNITHNREMRDEVARIVEEVGPGNFHPSLRVLYAGNISNSVDEDALIRHDIFGTAAYGIAGVFLLIAIYFRSLVVSLLIGLCLSASLACTFGVAYLVVGQLNTITGFLYAILFGLAIDYGIHSFARFREARRAGATTLEAIEEMVSKTGAALATTALTTAAAFYSLMLMDFRGFSELGFIAGTGMLFAFVGMVVLLPAATLLVDRRGWLRIPPRRPEERTAERRGRFPFARGILAVGLVLVLAAAYASTKVTFQYDFTDLRAITPNRRAASEMTRGVYIRSESPAIVLTDTRAEMREVMDSLEARRDRDTLSPTIRQISSVLALVPEDQGARLERIRAMRDLVATQTDRVSGEDRERLEQLGEFLAVDEPFTVEDLPGSERRRVVGRDGEIGNFVLVYPDVGMQDGRNAIAFRDDIGEITIGSGKTFYAASSNIIVAEMLTMILREGRIAVALSVLVVLLIVTAQFRGLRRGALVVSTLLIGLVGMGGAMAAFGLQLNIFNLVVLPSIVGIGVDSGVHVYHRYRSEGPGSLPLVMRHTGLAVVMATITTMVGYSGLLFASHAGLVSIGRLAILGLFTTLISAIVLFPALLQVLEDRQAAAIPRVPPVPGEDASETIVSDPS